MLSKDSDIDFIVEQRRLGRAQDSLITHSGKYNCRMEVKLTEHWGVPVLSLRESYSEEDFSLIEGLFQCILSWRNLPNNIQESSLSSDTIWIEVMDWNVVIRIVNGWFDWLKNCLEIHIYYHVAREWIVFLFIRDSNSVKRKVERAKEDLNGWNWSFGLPESEKESRCRVIVIDTLEEKNVRTEGYKRRLVENLHSFKAAEICATHLNRDSSVW
jgi:hypothetical protein